MTPELVQIETGAELVPFPTPTLPAAEQVREFIRASKAEKTLRGYQADWRDFCAWCGLHHLDCLPATAETVAAYIADLEGCAFSKDGLTVTLRRSKTDQEGAGRRVGIPYG